MLHLLFIRPLVSIFFGVNAIGVDHLSRLNQFIMISNHNSHIDTLLLFYILPLARIANTRVVAAADYFAKSPWIYRIVTYLFDPIWIDRNKKSCSVFTEMVAHLRNNGSIIMYPEGTRGSSAEMQDFKEGIGLLICRYPTIPVVPVYLEGPERSLPKNCRIPLPLVNFITLSPPQMFSGDKKEIAHHLFCHLQKLAKEEEQFRQRRKNAGKKPWCVSVIGIDGSGKSTLARNLATGFPDNCCFIGDSLEFYDKGVQQVSQPYVTNELRRWIGKKAKTAKKLSSYKLPKITELFLRDHLLTEVDRWYRPSIVFQDGSPLLNLVAWANLYSKRKLDKDQMTSAIEVLQGYKSSAALDGIVSQFPELQVICSLNLNQLRLPDEVVFLDVTPEVCVSRISSRGEHIQAHENIDHLTQLREAYHLVCESLLSLPCNVRILEGAHDPNTTTEQTLKYLQSRQERNHDLH